MCRFHPPSDYLPAAIGINTPHLAQIVCHFRREISEWGRIRTRGRLLRERESQPKRGPVFLVAASRRRRRRRRRRGREEWRDGEISENEASQFSNCYI